MSECIIGVERCGCITYANARPDELDRDDERAIARIVGHGGEIVRTTVDDARARPCFLVADCPHDPHGWEREQPKEPNRIRYSRVRGRNLSVVYVRVPQWPRGFRGGEVGKRAGSWWATEGWLDSYEPTATDGRSPRGPVPVLGPFKAQREAAEALIPLAEEKSTALGAEIDAGRRETVRS